MDKELQEIKNANKAEKYPEKNNYPGDSLDEHRAIETANIIIAENEIGQQNENL